MDPRNDVWRLFELSTGFPTDYEFAGYSLLGRMLMLSTVHLPLYMDGVVNLHKSDVAKAVEWNIHRPDHTLDRLNQLFQMIVNEAYMLFGEEEFWDKFPYIKRGLHTDTVEGVTKSVPYYFVQRDYVNVVIDEETGEEITTSIPHVPLYGHSLSVANQLHEIVGEVYNRLHKVAAELMLSDTPSSSVTPGFVSKGGVGWLKFIEDQLNLLKTKIDAHYGGCVKKPNLNQFIDPNKAPFGAIRRAAWHREVDMDDIIADAKFSHRMSTASTTYDYAAGLVFEGVRLYNGVASNSIGALDAFGNNLVEGTQNYHNFRISPDEILQGFHHEAAFVSDAYVKRYDNGVLTMDTRSGLDQIDTFCKRGNVITTVDSVTGYTVETPNVANPGQVSTKSTYTTFVATSTVKDKIHWFYHGLVPLPQLYDQAEYDALSGTGAKIDFLQSVCDKFGGQVFELKLSIDVTHQEALDFQDIYKPQETEGNYRSYRRPYPGTANVTYAQGAWQSMSTSFYDAFRREGIWNLQQDGSTGAPANNDGNYRYSGTCLSIPHMPDRFATIQYTTENTTSVFCTDGDMLFEFIEDKLVDSSYTDTDYIMDSRYQNKSAYYFIRRVRVRSYVQGETSHCKLNKNVCFRVMFGLNYGTCPWPQATGLYAPDTDYASIALHGMRSKPTFVFSINCQQLVDVYSEASGELVFPEVRLPHEVLDEGENDHHGSDVPPDGIHPDPPVPSDCTVSHIPHRALNTTFKEVGEPMYNHDTIFDWLGKQWNSFFGNLNKNESDGKGSIPEVEDFAAEARDEFHHANGSSVDCPP